MGKRNAQQGTRNVREGVNHVKLILVGASGVGKTSIMNRYARQMFDPRPQATYGTSYILKTVTVRDVVVQMDIWDTAGHERYRALAPMYYRGAHAAVVVYDTTDRESFDAVLDFIKDIRHFAGNKVPIVLVGNKSDMEDDIEVTEEEAKTLVSEISLLESFHVSAKSGASVNDIFMAIARHIAEFPVETPHPHFEQSIKLAARPAPITSSSSCGC